MIYFLSTKNIYNAITGLFASSSRVWEILEFELMILQHMVCIINGNVIHIGYITL